MHMADALLSPEVGGVMYAASAAAIAYSAKKLTKEDLGESKVPLMAVSGAMVFAAQMINFTIPGTGSSGHISGGILLAALLGPYAGLLSMAAVLVIQCLVFADGGLLALGANIFNMGVIPCLFVFPLIARNIFSPAPSKKRVWAGSMVSGIIALQLGAFAVVLQTTSSGITELPFAAFVLLMQPIHLAIGVVEGIVTAAILTFVYAARPQILLQNDPPSHSKRGTDNNAETIPVGGTVSGAASPAGSVKKVIIVFACIAAILAVFLSRFASVFPDGLEWSVQNVSGVAATEAPGVGAGAPVAGLIGALLVFALAGAAALIIRASRKRRKNALK